MDTTITADDYRALADFRYEIRKFLIVSERIARGAGMQPQQYMMLLALRGLPPTMEPTIVVLAERMQIRHNSAVELINRLAKRGLVRRYRSKSDSRKMLIRLTSAGDVLIEEIVRRRFNELVSGQPVLVKALNRIITVASGGSAMTTRYKPDKRAP
jgi:DNA-binding MarR family transcriptional regulator